MGRLQANLQSEVTVPLWHQEKRYL